MKRLCAVLLTLAVMLGLFAGIPTTANAAAVVAKGIDVSKWQMPVDWNAVAANPDIDYAIIRVSWSGLETTEWATFYAGAKAAGVPIGCYAYTMASTVDEAKAEAQKTVELLKGKQFEYPIYIDTEEGDIYNNMDKATLTAIVKAECDVLRDAGYMAGVYTNTWYATSKLDMAALSEYTVWLADYSTTPGYTGSFDMWQYSCTGVVNGVTGQVDMNYCYKDFPSIIKEKGLNGYEKTVPSNVVAKGIDVSKWQMPLDWSKVAADPNIDYAIIRVTWSGLETTEWSTFYPEAKAAGVPIGCYAYTMASTVADAKAEAQKTVELLKGKQFEYPIYIDAEEPSVYDSMDKATLTAIIKAECDVLREAGYMAGVYANTNYATNKIDMAQLSEYTVWIADYRGYCGYTGKHDMWQYTCEGSISATSSAVDMNYCYTDFPTYIKENGLNGYEKPAPDVDPKVEEFRTIKEQLPSVDGLTLTHADTVAQLKTVYDAISDKTQLTAEEVSYVNDALEKIRHLRSMENLGDVNGDKRVDAKDALEVLKSSVGKVILTKEQQGAAEVNGDGNIDAKDALEILKYAVGKIKNFPIESQAA